EPSVLIASASATAIACNGGTSVITISATGGTPAYSGTGSFTLTAGAYSFTVTDANGCMATTSVTVTEPSVLIASASATAIACNGGTSVITVSATGGTPAYDGTGSLTLTADAYSSTAT